MQPPRHPSPPAGTSRRTPLAGSAPPVPPGHRLQEPAVARQSSTAHLASGIAILASDECRESLRQGFRCRRRDADGAFAPGGARLRGGGLRQARVHEPDGERQGPHRPPHGRAGDGRRPAAGRRHGRRGVVRQHRHGPGDDGDRARPALRMVVRKQTIAGEARLPARDGRRARAGRRRRCLRSTPRATTRRPAGSPPRSPAPYFPDQHNNRENNEAHYRPPGPRSGSRWTGRIDYFVAGIGTGGTICGVARYLKEQDPKVKVMAVDIAGSVFTDHFHAGRRCTPHAPSSKGSATRRSSAAREFELIDDMVQVTDRDAFLAARELARTEAIFAGGSCGAALWGVRQLAPVSPHPPAAHRHPLPRLRHPLPVDDLQRRWIARQNWG